MATQISSDIATEVNITARKDDSFYLKITLTKADGTAYNFTDYEKATLFITNSNGDAVRTLKHLTTTQTLPSVASAIDLSESASGILSISVVGGNMSVPKGTYQYKLVIENETPVIHETITVMFGKFKFND
ncbi:MAG TPA: hypothetical protein DCM40_14960 [Maribacter sp.]|nr:hypothetical protein [Maribacter sp.]